MSVLSDPTPALSVTDVARLLTESRAHNLSRVRLGNRLRGKQHAPDYRAAEREAASALEKRLEAHRLDPTHIDPAWLLDTAPHDAIVEFLQGYAAIP